MHRRSHEISPFLLLSQSSPFHILSIHIFKDPVYYYPHICAVVSRMASFCGVFHPACHMNSLVLLPFHIPGQLQQLITLLLLGEDSAMKLLV
jgi:hypothetical protein